MFGIESRKRIIILEYENEKLLKRIKSLENPKKHRKKKDKCSVYARCNPMEYKSKVKYLP